MNSLSMFKIGVNNGHIVLNCRNSVNCELLICKLNTRAYWRTAAQKTQPDNLSVHKVKATIPCSSSFILFLQSHMYNAQGCRSMAGGKIHRDGPCYVLFTLSSMQHAHAALHSAWAAPVNVKQENGWTCFSPRLMV